jgi:probable F420-dependent oxidoreductase
MDFNVNLTNYRSFSDLNAVVEFVRIADDLGYRSVHIPEHVIFPAHMEDSIGACWWDPLLLAAHIAHHTKRIRILLAVVVVPQHSPMRLAKQLATLDWIAGGRLSVGVGAGWLEDEFQMMGSGFERRGARLEEHLRVMRTLWTDRPATFEGEHTSFRNASFEPKPLQLPHPPIYIGGGWRRSAERAARLGDGWMPQSTTDTDFKAGLVILEGLLAEFGRRRDSIQIVKRLPLWERSPETSRHIRESGGENPESLDGDLRRAREEVSKWAAAGVDQMWVELPGDPVRQLAELERFADEFIDPPNCGVQQLNVT